LAWYQERWPQPDIRVRKRAIDALVWVNDEHILALIEAIDGTYLHAIHIFAPNAVVGNDEGHDALFGQGRSGR
jgi:hypothetical protein